MDYTVSNIYVVLQAGHSAHKIAGECSCHLRNPAANASGQLAFQPQAVNVWPICSDNKRFFKCTKNEIRFIKGSFRESRAVVIRFLNESSIRTSGSEHGEFIF